MQYRKSLRKVLRGSSFFLLMLALGEPSVLFAKDGNHALTGKASWYGQYFHGKLTASGAVYDMYMPTAAHKTLPFGTVVEVKEAGSGLSTIVCITDRGPYIRGRVIDLSKTAALQMDMSVRGVIAVSVRVVSDASGTLISDDEAFFVLLPPQSGDVGSASGKSKMSEVKVGPYKNFADVCAIREFLAIHHPEARIILEEYKAQEEGTPESQVSLQSGL